MRSPYMDILEKITELPKTFVLPSSYDASIAATCIRAMAKNRKMNDVNVKKMNDRLLVWRGQLEEIPFSAPPRKYSVASLARAQVVAAFGEMRA